jgi:hypothetical protein
MLDFLPTGTNLTLKSPEDEAVREGPVLDGITVERRRAYKGIRFSVAAAEGRPERKDITGPHLLGYYNKYVEAWHGSPGFWDSLHDLLSVKDGPYAGLTLKEVEVAGPERDQSKRFPLDWIPQGASFHVKYPGDAPESEPCSFFMMGEQGPGFMPAGNPTLWSAEKLVASYCERFGLPNVRDPYSLIIWRQGEFKGLSLRACKALLDAEMVAAAAYDATWTKAKAQVEVEREERAAVAAAAFTKEEEATEPVVPAKLSVTEAKTLIEAKEADLLQQVAELEGLKTAQERVKALVARIAGLKSELNIQ